ncbi:Myotubularin-related protein 6 [Pitangus sulphuratus]|nr:Myotubularin-related protein 6 [Pitangus sulphuratus]
MEHIRTTKVEQVKLLDRFSTSNKSVTGTLYLTATHLLFIDSSQKETWILHHHIAAVEKLPLTTSGCPLVIQCKNFRIVHFVVPRERDCHDIYNSLLQLSKTAKYEELYAFSYNPKQNESEQVKGWQLIDLAEEYKRMGVPNAYWQLSDANRDYKAAICRCSQPLSGFSARCLEDEHMLQAISKANPSNRYMYVMDTRPKLNAMANRAAGKGYENEDNYSNIRFQFVGIENIHVMRSSLQKLLEVSGTRGLSVNDFLSGLENSGWLRHIKAVVDAAVFLVKVLIEKDWISFGHKFSDRCCQLDGDPKEISPVFTQFLECVWNLTEQFPQAFEYNEVFLLQIHEHVHSCQFGNFLGNCEKEREELKVKEKTYSLWPFLLAEQKKYRNPLYNPDFLPELTLLEPNTVSFNFKFWRNMYHQFDRSMHPRQSVLNLIMNLSEQNKQLEEDIKELEAKIKQRNGQSDVVLVKEHQQSAHPAPVALKTPPCFKKEQPPIPGNDAVRTIEGSNTADNRYSELVSEFSKAEPAVVSLEYGVARMTC